MEIWYRKLVEIKIRKFGNKTKHTAGVKNNPAPLRHAPKGLDSAIKPTFGAS